MSALDLDAITGQWLQQCGPHDLGLSEYGCACVDGDPRPVIANLVAEVKRLRALVDGRTTPAGPVDDDRVWISTPRRGIDMHAIAPGNTMATGCGRSRAAGGITVLAHEAVRAWECQPCPRCWPVTS